METYTAISIARDDVIIYYDEHEGGYEGNITNPSQVIAGASAANAPPPIRTSTQIWGDRFPANGFPPGHPDDHLALGEVIILREPEINVGTLSAIVDHDAGDIIASTDEIAVTRSFWASGSETLNAGSVELFPTSRWGTSYTLPIGENVNPSGTYSCSSENDPFQQVALMIMSDADNTGYSVNFNNGGGSNDASGTLDRGETAYINGQINAGTRITRTSGSGNLQVQVFTGDVGSFYGSRFYSPLPDSEWSNTYFAPFDSTSQSSGEAFLYNNNNSAIIVQALTGAGGLTNINIPANSVRSFVFPNRTLTGSQDATRFSSLGGQDFYVYVAMDSCDRNHDWGGALLPDNSLTSAMLIPIGFGNDPTNSSSGNYSPVWATPTASTFMYVDFDGDFVPDLVDLNGDGDTNDTVDGIAENSTANGFPVHLLQLVRIYDPTDQDQSGTLVWTLTTEGFTGGSAVGFIAGANIAGGWGQDARTEAGNQTPIGSPAIDVGTAFAPITFPANLPVTLNQFSSNGNGGHVRFRWTTASEAFTVGFNLWGRGSDGEWQQLNRSLVRNRVSDSTEPQSYRENVRVDRRAEISEVAISSIDTDGSEHFFGPFALGRSYGEDATPRAIAWQEIHAEIDQRMAEQGMVKVNGKWRHAPPRVAERIAERLARRQQRFQADFPLLHLETATEGMHRLTYEQLVEAGADFNGVPVSRIAITHKGEPVPRHVETARGNRFGPGSYIDFHADAVDDEDIRYTHANVYQLHVNPDWALPAASVDRKANAAAAPAYYIETVTRDVNVNYALNLDAPEPWYEHRLLGIPGVSTAHAEFPLTVDNLVGGVEDERIGLRLGMAGVTTFPGGDDDHRLSVTFNGASLGEFTSDGLTRWDIDLPLSAGALNDGDNTVRVEVPGVDGFLFDLVYGDAYSLYYPRAFVPRDDMLRFTAEDDAFEVPSFSNRDLVAYAIAGQNLARLRVITRRNGGSFTALFPGVAIGEATYQVSTVEALPSPAIITIDDAEDIADTPADYVIIAHGNFVEALRAADDFRNAKAAQGFQVKIVDVLDVYEQYGYGLPVPSAIRNYLAAQNDVSPISHVLIVGGATTDPLDYTGVNSIDFVPTAFAATNRDILHTPADGLLADIDDDGVPDLSIGRWPVRTVEELGIIVDKTLAFQSTMAHRRNALLVAGATDPSYPAFSRQVDKIADTLASGDPATPWTDLTRVYVDDYASIAAAQADLKQGFADGHALTIYGGHGSTSMWTFQGLLNTNVARSLANAGEPTLVGTMSCYTSYFTSPSTDTIAHQLLLSGDRGAAAIHGATTLSGYTSNEAFLQRATGAMMSGKSVGEGVQMARQALQGSYQDVVTNWALLGDPSLFVQP